MRDREPMIVLLCEESERVVRDREPKIVLLREERVRESSERERTEDSIVG